MKIGRVELSTFHLIALCVAVGFIVYGIFGYLSERRQSESDESLPFAGNIVPIAAANYNLGVRSDGSLAATQIIGKHAEYSDTGQTEVADWQDIVAVSAGQWHSVGLRSDGTVVATVPTDPERDFGQSNTSGWRDIIAVSAGHFHTVGLRADGSVVTTTFNHRPDWDGLTDVYGWSDIVAVAAGSSRTVGVRSDGTVVATGDFQKRVSDWRDIVAVDADVGYIAGLRSDGTVVVTPFGSPSYFDVSVLQDIVAISASSFHIVGLRSDGTVVATLLNQVFHETSGPLFPVPDWGQTDVSDWSDIVAVSAGVAHTLGLRSNGTVVVVGSDSFGQLDISDWYDIKIP